MFQNKTQAHQTEDGAEQDEEDDEESGDEADLSKYDLWGSDEERGTSSKKGYIFGPFRLIFGCTNER